MLISRAVLRKSLRTWVVFTVHSDVITQWLHSQVKNRGVKVEVMTDTERQRKFCPLGVSLRRQQQQPWWAFYGGTHKWSAFTWCEAYYCIKKVSWLKSKFSILIEWGMDCRSSKRTKPTVWLESMSNPSLQLFKQWEINKHLRYLDEALFHILQV